MKKVEATIRARVYSTVDLIVHAVRLSELLEVSRLLLVRLSRKLGVNLVTKPSQQKVIMVIQSLEVEPGQPYHLPDGAKKVGFERLPDGKTRILYGVTIVDSKG
jgi:hypothetical protein